MKKTIAAASLAASFSAGYYTAPKVELPHSTNPAIIKLGEENQRAVDRYRREVRTSRTNDRRGENACECKFETCNVDRLQSSSSVPSDR